MWNLKKMISGMTAAATAISTVAAAAMQTYAIDDWDGSADTSWYNSIDSEFTLTTPEELAGLAEIVNNETDNFSNKTIYLGGDIAFCEFADADAWSENAGTPGYEWQPIGAKYATPFKGTFDGKGFTISGIYIESEGGTAGFIGYAGSGSVIRNLTLTDSFIASVDTYSGGICGYNHRALIEDCVNKARIESYYYIAGGVCGVNAGGTVEGSSNSGRIIGSKGSGGIAGEVCENGAVHSSKNSGSITASKSAGGVCGQSGDNLIEGCYNTGSIKGGTEAGGITGCSIGSSQLKCCYNMRKVVNTGGLSGGVTGSATTKCSSCFYLEGMAEAGITKEGVSVFTKEMLSNGELTALLGSTFSQGKEIPVLSWEDGSVPPQSSASTTSTTTSATTTATTTATTVTTTPGTSSTVSSKTTASSETSVTGKIRIWAVNNVKVLNGAGEKVQLIIDGNTKTPVWSSLNTDVATVDQNGMVTAKSNGTVTIIASVDGTAASYIITVGSQTSAATSTSTSSKTTTTSKATTTGKTTSTTTATTVTTTTASSTTMQRYGLGDCNGNGKIEIADAEEVLKYYACLAAGIEAKFSDNFAENTLSLYAADVDHDGKITLTDAAKILAYYSKLAAGLAAAWE